MNSLATGLGALGGLVVFAGALVAVARGIFKQINATEANTEALLEFSKKLDSINGMVGNHESRISRLEGAMDEQDRRWRGAAVPRPRHRNSDQPGGQRL